MLTLFLVCLIIGGGLLAFSLLSGTHDNPTLDHSGEIHFDHELDYDADAHTNFHLTSHELNQLDTHNVNATDTIKFFSLRNFIYFLTFFGLTGTLLTLFDINSIIALISSFGIGIFSYVFGFKLMKYFKSSETGEIVNIYNLIGRTAKVEMDIVEEKKGKILVNLGGRLIELIAIKSENEKAEIIKAGDEVLITEIEQNIAIVEKIDF